MGEEKEKLSLKIMNVKKKIYNTVIIEFTCLYREKIIVMKSNENELLISATISHPHRRAKYLKHPRQKTK